MISDFDYQRRTRIDVEYKFVLTMGGSYITDEDFVYGFCINITQGIPVSERPTDVPESIIFDTYEEAYKKMMWIYKEHRLLKMTKNKDNFLSIKPVKYIKAEPKEWFEQMQKEKEK